MDIRSDLIVLAKVEHILSVLKGALDHDEAVALLQVRGGLKEFDPKLKTGDIGVFFLKNSGTYYRTTHGGSIAIFKKHHFK